MPISQNTYTVPNNFVQQYDLGQKKIRADLVDENFTDAAGAINTLLTSVATNDAAAVHKTGAETISGAKTFSGNNTFSGTNAFGANTTGVTATAGDNSTKYATTAYVDAAAAAVVVPSASSSTPAARSASGAVGSSTAYARADHSHPNNWGSTTVAAASPAVVVETWHSGTEWYRVWSDGWIEQGGQLPVSTSTHNFPKAFTAVPLSVQITLITASTQTDDKGTATATKTALSYTGSGIARWFFACGY